MTTFAGGVFDDEWYESPLVLPKVWAGCAPVDDMHVCAVKLSPYHIAGPGDMEHFYLLMAVALYQKMICKDGIVTDPTALWAFVDGDEALEVDAV